MESVAQMVSRHGHARIRRLLPGLPALPPAPGGVRGWQAWSLPGRARALVAVVVCADLAWAAALAVGYAPAAHDLVLFLALLGYGAATVGLARRESEPSGGARDVYVVWELPVVIHLPPLYALAVPALRMALTQWRAPRGAPYRRAYAAAAIGLAYGCAATAFHAMIPAGMSARDCLRDHATWWLLAVACCALTQWAITRVLLLALTAAGDRQDTTGPALAPERLASGKPTPAKLMSREALRNDATELCAATLVALCLQISPLALVVAFPLGTLLQRSSRHAELVNEARADSKTGLLNAAAWEREATAELARAARTAAPLAVALLDLDRFKAVNDTYGHLLGDEVLRRIAAAMGDNLREYDLAGRFGGEEFVILLPQTRAVDALRIAERIRAHIAQLPIYSCGAERVPVTVSIGVAALDGGSRRELAGLLAAADAALYRAKADGRDQVQMISTSRGLCAVRPPSGPSAGPGLNAAAARRPEAGTAPSAVPSALRSAVPAGMPAGVSSAVPSGVPSFVVTSGLAAAMSSAVPDGAHGYSFPRGHDAGRAGDLIQPKRGLHGRHHGQPAAGGQARAGAGQLGEADPVDGVAGRASTATTSAVPV